MIFPVLHIFSALLGGDSDPAKQAYYVHKADQYLVKDAEVRDYFDIRADGVYLFSSADARARDSAEFVLYWNEVQVMERLLWEPEASAMRLYTTKGTSHWNVDSLLGILKPPAPYMMNGPHYSPLKGLRVAIDPGHLGGTMDMAKTERKQVRMRATDHPSGQEIAFNEGNLTLATAWLLREKLEAQGAEVMMTRTEPGQTPWGISYQQWKATRFRAAVDTMAIRREWTQKEKDKMLNETNEKNIFYGLYNVFDLEERARMMNAFKPHLTVIIHYNVKESNEPDAQWYQKPVQENYSMAFVPGAWMSGELSRPEWRYEFLCKLISDDYEKSIRFSAGVVEEFEKHLNVPIMEWDSTLKYLRNASLRTGERGVFARNLALNRQVQGVMCFGETLYQDNVDESGRLNAKDITVHGVKAPARVREVADAYYEAILKWEGN